jgi:ArsR family transcriptional regulator
MNKIIVDKLPRNTCCAPAREAETDRLYTDLEESALLFRALADETRLAILRQLREQGEVCACDFLACCRLAQPTVSHHLQILRRAGLVKTDKRGLWVYYTLNEDKLAALKGRLP